MNISEVVWKINTLEKYLVIVAIYALLGVYQKMKSIEFQLNLPACTTLK